MVLFWFEIVTLSDFTSCMFFPYVYLPTVCLHVLTFSSPTQHGTYRAGIWNIQYTSNNSFLLAIDFIVLFSNLKKTLKSNLQIFKYHIYIYIYIIFFLPPSRLRLANETAGGILACNSQAGVFGFAVWVVGSFLMLNEMQSKYIDDLIMECMRFLDGTFMLTIGFPWWIIPER